MCSFGRINPYPNTKPRVVSNNGCPPLQSEAAMITGERYIDPEKFQ